VIPRVVSAYPNWDPVEGAIALDRGHEQPEVTPVDGRLARIAQMPHESPWPAVLALALALVFTMLLIRRWGAAGIMGIVCVLALVGWHSQEPPE
jgi:hypothetical protein